GAGDGPRAGSRAATRGGPQIESLPRESVTRDARKEPTMAIERAGHEGRAQLQHGDRSGLSRGLGCLGVGLGVAALAAVLGGRRREAVAVAAVSGVAALSARLSTRRGGLRRARAATPITRAITINRPVEEVYAFWRDVQNLPRFMRHLESVRVIDA